MVGYALPYSILRRSGEAYSPCYGRFRKSKPYRISYDKERHGMALNKVVVFYSSCVSKRYATELRLADTTISFIALGFCSLHWVPPFKPPRLIE